MKVIAFYICLVFSACTEKVDRNHLIFRDSISAIERNILIVDSLLSKLPEQTDPDRIQSYYYEIIDGDSLLFIHGNQIGDIHRIPVKSLAKHLNMSNAESSKFKGASLILLKNDIAHCLNDFCGWTYVYQFSNDRRPVQTINL